MAPLSMTRHLQRSPLSPRHSAPASLSTTALITGAVVGSVVTLISLCAWIVRHGRLQKLKKQVEEDRQREEKRRHIQEVTHRRDALLAEQKPIWEGEFHEEDIPHDMLAAYKHEFFSLSPEDREAMVPVSLRRKWDDAATMGPEDSVSIFMEHGLDRQTNEGWRRFVRGKWWEDHGRLAVLAELDSSANVRRDNFSLRPSPVSTARHPKFVDVVDLPSGSPRNNFSSRSNLMSPTRNQKYVDVVDFGRGPSGLQRNNFSPHSTPTSPTRGQICGENMEPGGLPPQNLPYGYKSPPPPNQSVRSSSRALVPHSPPPQTQSIRTSSRALIPQSPPPPTQSTRSDSRTLVPQPRLNSPISQIPNVQIYSPDRELQDHDDDDDDRYNTHSTDNTKPSGFLEAPITTRAQKAISMAPSDFTMGSAWDMPEGYEDSYNNRQSTFTDAETVLTNDGFRGDAERNRAERRQGERERELKRHEEELREVDMRDRLETARRFGR